MEAASVESNSSSGLVVAIKVLDGTAVGWLKAGKYAKFASWLLGSLSGDVQRASSVDSLQASWRAVSRTDE
mgnify:CR=1 FL=1